MNLAGFVVYLSYCLLVKEIMKYYLLDENNSEYSL